MNRRMLITTVAMLALGAGSAFAQSAGKPMKITLNFLAAAPNAGFMMAKQLGLYEKAGINLTIEEGKGSGTTAQMVATGQTDIGFADAPAAMQLRTKGAPVKIIAPVLQTNGFAIIALEDSKIDAPKDLVGKKLAVQPGTAQTTLLEAILASNGIDKSKVDVIAIDPGAFVGALLEKKVDAILGGADFHSIQIRERGFKVRDIFYRDVGVPTVGLSIIARDDRIKADAELFKRFVDASLRGWDAARKNPEAAADAVVAQFPAVKKAQVLAQFDVVNKLLCAPGATALGKVPATNWTVSYDLLTQYLGLPKDKPITDYYTTELLPASAPACP
ncbi:ABC transporter substrate-binding protein [Bosea sp. 685]|uniref:ABC transporter substrate-binding protein n=1 Tax=Bosea sp. 685 TaxID=3080057 RepID=UPI002892BCC8|nr:ABC transporter substrate-binding protein [Bosea sp. 685]WNJ90323.1 ABC transporter substrate-binding protein [Bosea sp. 685]